jgi:SAM-dependent methyltransferase
LGEKPTKRGGSATPRGSFFDFAGDHVQRYVWVSNLVRGLKVIDVGCGHGYGSDYLSGVAESVMGVDSDREAIGFALRNYASRNLMFRLMDVCALELLGDLYDAAVFFEVIEHLPNPRACLSSIAKILKTGGCLYLSTPNRKYSERFYVDNKSPNRFHLREYSPEEMERLLGEFFTVERVFREASTTGLEAIIDARAQLELDYQKSFFLPNWMRKLVPDAVKDAWLNLRGFNPDSRYESVVRGKWKEYRIEETTVGELDAKFQTQLYCCKKAT